MKIIGSGGGKSGGGGSGISEDPDTLSSIARARFVDLVSEGPIKGLVNADQSVYVDGVPLKDTEGTANYKPFRYVETLGTQDQEPIPGFSGTQQENPVGIKLTFPQGKLIRNIPDAGADSVRVTVSVPGLTHTTSDGKLVGTEVAYRISVRVAAGSWVEGYSGRITGKTTSTYQRSHEIMLGPLGPGPYDVAVERLTADSTSALLVNDLYWDSYAIINFEQFSYPNSALIATEIDGRYFSQIPRREYHVQGLLVRVPTNYDPESRIYSGVWDGTWKVAYTNNPAWCFYDLVTNKRYGLGKRISDAQISKWNMYEIARYCDEYVITGVDQNVGEFTFGQSVMSPVGGVVAAVPTRQLQAEPRFTLNCVINTKDDAYRVLNNLASVFRGMTYWSSGMVMLSQDRPADTSMIWTNANVENGQFVYEGSSKSQRHTVVTVAWNDPSEGYKQKFEYVEDRAGIARFGIRSTDIVAFGCTSRSQARRAGLWLLYTQRIEKEAIRFVTGADSARVMPGDIGEIMDVKRAGVRWGGRVAFADAASVTLDSSLELTAGNYTLLVMGVDGSLHTKAVNIASTGTFTQLAVAIPFDTPPQINAIWSLKSDAVVPVPVRVISVKQEGSGTYEITCIEHNSSKYGAIESGDAYVQQNYSFLTLDSVESIQNLVARETSFRHNVNVPVTVQAEVGWKPASNNLIRGYLVEYRGTAGTHHEFPEQKASTITITGLSPDLYTFTVRAVNHLGRVGPPGTTDLIITALATPSPDQTPAADVQSLTVEPVFARLRIRWPRPTYAHGGGNAATRIYYADYAGTGPLPTAASAIQLVEIEEPASYYDDEARPGTQRHYWAKHVSRAGVVSAEFTGGTNGEIGILPNFGVLSLLTSSQVFRVTDAGENSPASITLTALGQNLTGPITWTTSAGVILSGSGSSRTLAYADMTTDTATVQIEQDGYSDTVTLVKLREGNDALSILLTNETHSLPANSAGTVSSYAGASTSVVVYRGFVNDTSNWTLSKVDTGLASNLVGATITVTGMPDEWDVGYVDVTATRDGFPTLTKRFTISKARAGNQGGQGAPGAPGVSGNLSSYSIVLPADSTGAVTSYLNASTTMSVFQGGVDDTSNWNITRVDGPSITSSVSGSTATITSLAGNVDASYVDVYAIRSGYPAIVRRVAVSKAKAGATGSTGNTGATGPRGTVQLSRAIPATSWSDAYANLRLTEAGYGAPVSGDVVTLTNVGAGYAESRVFSGGSWLVLASYINGALLVDGTVVASKVDTRGIEVKDNAGNVLFSVNVPLSIDRIANNYRIQNNLIDSSWWSPTVAPESRWALNGDAAENSFMFGTGPKGHQQALWRMVAGASGTTAGNGDGGWHTVISIDRTKTYRFAVPVYRESGSGSNYWGIDNVCDLNTTTPNGNPYFASSSLSAGRWYLMVGYVFPAGSTGSTNTGAGIYDLQTGDLVVAGTNWTWTPTAAAATSRAYQYYATAGAESRFAPPMVHVVDGSEPSLKEYFSPVALLNRHITIGANGQLLGGGGGQVTITGLGYTGSLNATADIRLVATGSGMSVAGNMCVRSGGGSWDAQCYSLDAFRGGASASFIPSAGTSSHFMAGLNTDPTTDANYASIDYAFYMAGDATLYVYESGGSIGAVGTYALGDVLTVAYDGSRVYYMQNGTVVRSVAAPGNLRFYFDSSIVHHGLVAIRFLPYGNPSAISPTNPITGANASTFIQDAAIGTAQINELNAIKLTALSITTDKLQIGSVTANVSAAAGAAFESSFTFSGSMMSHENRPLLTITKQQGPIVISGHLRLTIQAGAGFTGDYVSGGDISALSISPASGAQQILGTPYAKFVRRSSTSWAAYLTLPVNLVIPASAPNVTYTVSTPNINMFATTADGQFAAQFPAGSRAYMNYHLSAVENKV